MISKQTSLDLNGPILSFLQQPQSVSVCDGGSATFVGIATATFPTQDPQNSASNTGSLSYRWYAEGFGPLSEGSFQGATISGTGTTTLTVVNAKTPTTNAIKFYLGVDYIPSAYVQPVGSESNVGTARSTGNAVNEILNSNTATLTVFPIISVATQPTEQTVAQNRTATFTTLGALTDTTQGSISYRWQLNEVDLVDGSSTTSPTPDIYSEFAVLKLPLWDNGTGQIAYTDLSNNPKTITPGSIPLTWNTNVKKWYNGSANFPNSSSAALTVTPTTAFAFGANDFTIECWVYFTSTGFSDIFSTGIYQQNQLSFRKNASSQIPQISPGTEQLEIYYNATIIASGGNFQLNRWYHVAASRSNGLVRLFIDGTKVAEGNFSNSISANSVKIGSVDGNSYPMGGYIQDLSIYSGVAKYTSDFSVSDLSLISSTNPVSINVSGATTPELTISSNQIKVNQIRARLSHPTSCNSPIFTNTVNFNVVSAREILNFESVNDNGGFLGSGSVNIFNNPTTFNADPNNVVRSLVIYPPEKDIRVRITLAAAAGSPRGARGGEGGLSVFEYTLKQNTEYTFKLGAATQPTGGANGGGGAAYLYEKARLIAVCGGGGGSGTSNRGGDGGGVNVGGEFGLGRNGGAGGRVVTAGNLPTGSGAFTSGSSGGQVSGCTIGDHYRFLGFSPCQDVGQRQWTGFTGSVASQTAVIQRGYKAGLGYRNNGGNGGGNEGGGGSGAYGGNAAVSDGSGGGGGSGYTDGSISVISTRLGGNSSTNAFVRIESFV